MKKSFFKTVSVFLAVLMLSMAFVPVVSAQADQQKITALENEIADVMSRTELLKDDAESKVVAAELDDGSVFYAVSWNDPEIDGRVNFALMTEADLISEGYLKSSGLSNFEIADAVTRASYSFWNGSYISTYGNSVTGGFNMYLSPVDAPFVFNNGATVAGALGRLVFAATGLGSTVAYAVGVLITVAIKAMYHFGKNPDGSIVIQVPYASAIAYAAGLPGYIKVGSITYWF
ncbi:hypothetical protein MmiAt1_07430 [Methanimicrococcus sp. At1]|uniref:Uncharacterized protein n=1 Tax=Methanimicrococcus hacksteinii TaxID=3028293 RepID=A0ABU3VP62_9EURY|nr:hypothetical protein [Methanimicrococcus sp. At1]MDV0445186.1 hypothetical protein [Methanimicrococcus sp. At1]